MDRDGLHKAALMSIFYRKQQTEPIGARIEILEYASEPSLNTLLQKMLSPWRTRIEGKHYSGIINVLRYEWVNNRT